MQPLSFQSDNNQWENDCTCGHTLTNLLSTMPEQITNQHDKKVRARGFTRESLTNHNPFNILLPRTLNLSMIMLDL